MHAAAAALLVTLLHAPIADGLDDFVREQMQTFHLPGLSFALVEKGRIVRVGAYGVADVTRGTAATPATVYKIGSVSKQFIATAIMLLVQEGRLDVDHPVTRYLDGAPAAWQAITVRHVLTHTAGFAREPPAFDPMKAIPDAEIVRALYSVPLRFLPGTKWEYSNAGYYVLAEVVSRVSGRPWAEFLAARVFVPAGMRLTLPTNVRENPPNRAAGYTGNDNRDLAPEWIALRPSGAFLSTVGDLAKWDALLDTDGILTERSRREMWTPVRLNDGSTYPYGFGWHAETAKDGRRLVWHGGGLPGFASYFGRFLDNGVSVIVLVNGDDVDVASVARGLAARYLRSRPAVVVR